MRAKILVLLALSVLLSACAYREDALPPGKSDQYKRLGVVSVMGDSFIMTPLTLGVTNTPINMPIGLGADPIFVNKLTKLLGERYEVVDLSRHRAALAKAYWPMPMTHLVGPGPAPPSPGEVARSLPDLDGLDALVVTRPIWTEFMGRPQNHVIGIGIAQQYRPFMTDLAALHVAYSIGVIDLHDYTIAADMHAFAPGLRAYPGVDFGMVLGPSIVVPIEWMKDPQPHKDEIERLFNILVDTSVDYTLGRIKLLPPPARLQ